MLAKYIEQIREGFIATGGKAYIRVNELLDLTPIIEQLSISSIKKTKKPLLIVYEDINRISTFYEKVQKDSKLKELIKFTSIEYIKYKSVYNFIIYIGSDNVINLQKVINKCYYYLLFLDNTSKNSASETFVNQLRIIVTKVNPMDINFNKPVREELVSVPMTPDDKQLLEKYTNFINNTICAIGDFTLLEQCRVGNPQKNMSAIDCCYKVAYDNGWSKEIDTTIEYNRAIDEIYNPNEIYERAKLFYDIVRKRQNLLLHNSQKIYKILDIVRDNKDSRIIIVNKSSDYTKEVYEKLSELYQDKIIGIYSNEVTPMPMYDNNGEYIKYKTGNKKGEIKLFGAQAISKASEAAFNSRQCNILSMKFNTPTKPKLAKIDIVIFTSSQHSDIFSFRYKYPNIDLSNIKVYTLYNEESNELKKLDERSNQNLIIRETKNEEIQVLNSGEVML